MPGGGGGGGMGGGARGQNLEHLPKVVFLCWSFLEVYIFATTYWKAFIVGPKVPFPTLPYRTLAHPPHTTPTLLYLPYPYPYLTHTHPPFPTPPNPILPNPILPNPTLPFPTPTPPTLPWPAVHPFKHEYLRNQQAEFNQILSDASFGWGIDCIRFWTR